MTVWRTTARTPPSMACTWRCVRARGSCASTRRGSSCSRASTRSTWPRCRPITPIPTTSIRRRIRSALTARAARSESCASRTAGCTTALLTRDQDDFDEIACATGEPRVERDEARSTASGESDVEGVEGAQPITERERISEQRRQGHALGWQFCDQLERGRRIADRQLTVADALAYCRKYFAVEMGRNSKGLAASQIIDSIAEQRPRNGLVGGGRVEDYQSSTPSSRRAARIASAAGVRSFSGGSFRTSSHHSSSVGL